MKAKTEACVSFFLISFGFVASFAPAPAQPPQQPEFVKLRSAVDAGWKGGRGVGTLSPDSPDFAEFGSCQRRGWERTRPDGERRGGTEVFHQGNRCCGHARGQGISQESDGNVIRVRGGLQENHRVRTTGVRLPRQREELLSAGRDCERGGTRLYRFRRFGHCVQVVPDWPRHGLKEPDIKPARQDLWNFRWEHAQARIAARRGDQAEAQKHVAAAKAILDKGTIPAEPGLFPYLKGYVAFYAGDYKVALEELKQANQNDPFIQCMIGQTYEKLGEKDEAMEYYRKASTAVSHNPAAAYAIPFAKKKLS